jgi:hypothetical protein
LVENGFRTRTSNFQQDWFIPDSDQWPKDCLGMKRIAWSRNLIGDRMREYAENAERQKEKEQNEKLVEKSRKVSDDCMHVRGCKVQSIKFDLSS